MKARFVFGFILLILLIIGVFVGLPYAILALKSGSLSLPFSLPTGWQNFTKIVTKPALNYFFDRAPTSTSTPVERQNVKKVSVSNVSRFGQGEISLQASYFTIQGEKVNITGWKIKSSQKGETIIGRGYGLPQVDAALSDIFLGPGESADIIIGPGPLAGNFRINNCFGWLSNVYNIDYSLSYCPRITLSDLSGLGSQCQELILNTSSCRAPADDILNGQSSQCRVWVEKNLNYNACAAKRRNDSDFFRGWRIYTGNNNQIYDLLHDKIELRDPTGSLIDSYEY